MSKSGARRFAVGDTTHIRIRSTFGWVSHCTCGWDSEPGGASHVAMAWRAHVDAEALLLDSVATLVTDRGQLGIDARRIHVYCTNRECDWSTKRGPYPTALDEDQERRIATKKPCGRCGASAYSVHSNKRQCYVDGSEQVISGEGH